MIASPSHPIENALSPMAAAADVMTPLSRTCSPFSTVTEAVMIFKDENTDMIPIVDAGKPVGVVVDRDVALAVPDVPDLGSQPVTSVMNKNIPTIPADAGLDEIARALAETGSRWLLVVNAEGTLLGCVHRAALVQPAPIGAVVSANDREAPQS